MEDFLHVTDRNRKQKVMKRQPVIRNTQQWIRKWLTLNSLDLVASIKEKKEFKDLSALNVVINTKL